jgi:DNA-binding GntR family transcriptional regulator
MKSLKPSDELPDDRSRAEYAYDQLKAKLRAGELHAGQRLRETEIAEALNISRTPVREALRRIAADGLVQVVAGRGLIVAEFNQQQVRDLFAVRGLLEGGAARLAAQFASDADLALIRDLLNRSSAKESPTQLFDLDSRFHRAIHKAARNRYLEQALEQMWNSIALLPGTTFSVPGRAATVFQEHSAILDALEQRNADKAERAARYHIERALAVRIGMMSEPVREAPGRSGARRGR